jgi:hypothetical protein
MQALSQTASLSTKTPWAGYIISGFVILFLLFDGVIKLMPITPVTDAMSDLGFPTSAGFARTLGVLTLVCAVLYAIPQTVVLGAILLTGLFGGAIASHVRIGSPLFTHTLFGVYLGVMVWGGLFLRDERLRALIPFRR